jgi:hypothetical protein
MRNKFKTPSYSSPKKSRRGCLCSDGTYSKKCCNGNLSAQGIGKTRRGASFWDSIASKWDLNSDNWNK